MWQKLLLFFCVCVSLCGGRMSQTPCSHHFTADLINQRLRFGLAVDISAQFDQTLGHRCVLVLAGFLQHAVVQLRVAPHLVQRQAHRLAELKGGEKKRGEAAVNRTPPAPGWRGFVLPRHRGAHQA